VIERNNKGRFKKLTTEEVVKRLKIIFKNEKYNFNLVEKKLKFFA